MSHSVQKEICIALSGMEYWCENLARQLERGGMKCVVIRSPPANPVKYLAWIVHFFKETARCNILHIMYPTGAIKTLRAARLKDIQVICHWVGSDVLKLRNRERRQKFFKVCGDKHIVHLAVSESLSSELAQYGINVADVIPNITDKIIAKPEPLPTKPAVLSYWHDKRAEFFNASTVLDLARGFPNIQFRIVAATGKGLDSPPNVHFPGYIKNMSEVFQQTTVYIRLVPHDGTPMMVVESLARGRYVIYNHPFPHCEQAVTIDELKEKLGNLLVRKEPNVAGAKFVQTRFNIKKNMTKLERIYRELLSSTCSRIRYFN